MNCKIDFFSTLLLFVGFFIGQSLAYAIGLGFSAFLGENVQNAGWFNVLAYSISMLVPIAFFDFFIVRKESNGEKLNFRFSTEPVRVYLLIFPMMFGMMLVADYVTQLIPTNGFWLGEIYKLYQEQFSKLMLDPVALIIMTAIIAPILEEILFRGIVMKGLLNNKVNPISAIIISALVFGIMHFNPWQFAGASLLGLVLGLVYYKTKSLLMPILLHAFNNLVSAILMLVCQSESFSEVFKINPELLLVIGIVLFAIPFYFFAIQKNILYKD